MHTTLFCDAYAYMGFFLSGLYKLAGYYAEACSGLGRDTAYCHVSILVGLFGLRKLSGIRFKR